MDGWDISMRTPSYAQFPTFAISYEADSGDENWIDLPCHKILRDAAEDWFHGQNTVHPFTIKGDTGVGKTLWLKEFTNRHRRDRIRVIYAQITKEQATDSVSVVRQWAHQAQLYADRPEVKFSSEAMSQWLALAIRSMKNEGYRVILVVESARMPKFDQPELLETHRIHLQRKVFQSSLSEGLVLAPWSNDELAQILRQRWPEQTWAEEVVEQIWSSTLGQGRLAMELAESISRAMRVSRSSMIPDDFMGKVMRAWDLRGFGMAKPTPFEFNFLTSGTK
jgi:hypothetical protein